MNNVATVEAPSVSDYVKSAKAFFMDNRSEFVDKAVTAFKNGKANAHLAASIVLEHSVKTGDVNPLNRMLDKLGEDTNEGKKFKIWVGNMSRVKDGSETINTLTFSKDDGFRIRKGTANLRGVLFPNGVEGLVESTNFLDWKAEKKEKPFDMAALMKAVRAKVKKAEETAEEEGVSIPTDILNRMEELNKVIDQYMPGLEKK